MSTNNKCSEKLKNKKQKAKKHNQCDKNPERLL